MDIDTLMKAWYMLRPYLIKDEVEDAAVDYIKQILDEGITIEELSDHVYDEDLRAGILDHLGEEEEEDEEEED